MSKTTFDFRWKDFFRKPNKRIEIITEKKQTLKIRRIMKRYQSICQKCQEDTVFLSITETARLFEVDLEIIELFIAEEVVHFIKLDDFETMICLKSIIFEMDSKINII